MVKAPEQESAALWFARLMDESLNASSSTVIDREKETPQAIKSMLEEFRRQQREITFYGSKIYVASQEHSDLVRGLLGEARVKA
jgi:hypothetical protein